MLKMDYINKKLTKKSHNNLLLLIFSLGKIRIQTEIPVYIWYRKLLYMAHKKETS